MRRTIHTAIFMGACLPGIHFAYGQWRPGQAYDINQEIYTTRVLWETDQANFSDRINEYRGYHHILASYRRFTYIAYIDMFKHASMPSLLIGH